MRDAAKWATYRSLVPGTLTAWGATIVARGASPVTLTGARSGPTRHRRVSRRRVRRGWYASPSYQALVPLRDEAADVTIVAYEHRPAGGRYGLSLGTAASRACVYSCAG